MAPKSNAGSWRSASEESSPAPEGHSPIKRRPTNSSYYDFNGVPSDKYNAHSQAWMYAGEARIQMAGIPAKMAAKKAAKKVTKAASKVAKKVAKKAAVSYPSFFGNSGDLALTTPRSFIESRRRWGWLHYPLNPGQTETPNPNKGCSGVRGVYAEGDPTNFDVIYHDSSAGTTCNGKEEFSMARYIHAHLPTPHASPPPSPSTKNFPPLGQVKKFPPGA